MGAWQVTLPCIDSAGVQQLAGLSVENSDLQAAAVKRITETIDSDGNIVADLLSVFLCLSAGNAIFQAS